MSTAERDFLTWQVFLLFTASDFNVIWPTLGGVCSADTVGSVKGKHSQLQTGMTRSGSDSRGHSQALFLLIDMFDSSSNFAEETHWEKKNQVSKFVFFALEIDWCLGDSCLFPRDGGESTTSVGEYQRWLVSWCLQALLDVIISALALSWQNWKPVKEGEMASDVPR